MPSALEVQRQQLRTQIARSRRRLDRDARQLTPGISSFVALARWIPQSSGRSWLVGLTAGFVLAKWTTGRAASGERQDQLLGRSLAQRLDRLLRRLRVAIWQARRQRAATEPDPAEVTDE
jgi:hypothetical protein